MSWEEHACQFRNAVLYADRHCAILEKHMDICEWKNKNDFAKRYAHFDKRVRLSAVWDDINNPDVVSKHGFFPFIHYTKIQNKYKRGEGVVTKERELCYAAHIDRCIYLLYAYKLSELYNARVIADGTSECAVAYRTDLGKCNIHFAHEVFDFIKGFSECHILVGDFTNFFDNLDHKYLKNRLLSLLNEKYLPSDYYAVYKNITRYSLWELTELLKLYGLSDKPTDIKKLNEKDRVLSTRKFRECKKKYITPNKDDFGIPQGSPISAVLSNIYMLDFDKRILDLVKDFGGKYMRYSDDFIIVAPIGHAGFGTLIDTLFKIIDSVPRLALQKEKTKIFRFSGHKIESVGDACRDGVEKSKNALDYLGFTFDGAKVQIRDRTITKYNYRMRRKIKDVLRQADDGDAQKMGAAKKALYRSYSDKGANLGRGNFLTYVERSVAEFDGDGSLRKGTERNIEKIGHLLRHKKSKAK
jgi:hypothetical protein